MLQYRFATTIRCAAIALAIGASGVALADDNSMSPLTGDSYAYFNGLDFTPGAFNVAHATPAPSQTADGWTSALAGAAAANPAAANPAAAATRPALQRLPDERPTLLAGAPRIAPSKTFDDGTGA